MVAKAGGRVPLSTTDGWIDPRGRKGYVLCKRGVGNNFAGRRKRLLRRHTLGSSKSANMGEELVSSLVEVD